MPPVFIGDHDAIYNITERFSVKQVLGVRCRVQGGDL